ncbi:hypothetical protein RDWZM_000803 [Blomia tropicalis]|uniref:SGS domain-containing protein n=1 Tax=Blomia tropicalis TaxID=40697 RepID=A0A9Q0M9K3_BLOTA|nr:hypothetical protein RDWZM_000803 [Blomia tropicalis]
MSIETEIKSATEEICELNKLLDLATLSSVKSFLKQEIDRLTRKKESLESKKLQNEKELSSLDSDAHLTPFTLSRLYKNVDMVKTSEMGVKVSKSNRVTITLYKEVKGNWASLQMQADSLKESLAEEKDLDPSASLMRIMKNMYDQGDDDMKRTIAKTWYESQHKKGGDMESMGLPDF